MIVARGTGAVTDADGGERVEPGQVKTRADLAAALTALRERAGLSVREVAKAADVPTGTVSGYLSGRHVPPASAQKQVRAVLAACGVTDAAEVELWLSAIRRVRRTPGRRAADAPSPYRGLASFQADDAGWFFGREALTDALVAPGRRRRSRRAGRRGRAVGVGQVVAGAGRAGAGGARRRTRTPGSC